MSAVGAIDPARLPALRRRMLWTLFAISAFGTTGYIAAVTVVIAACCLSLASAASAEVRPGVVSGTVRAPGSKSETHRAFLLAAQSAEPCLVRSPLHSADPQATLACLHAMGGVSAQQASVAPTITRIATVVNCRPASRTFGDATHSNMALN